MAQKEINKELFQPAKIDSSKSEEINKPSLNYWQDAWLRVRKNKAAVFSLIVIVLLTLLAFIGPAVSGYDSARQKATHANLPPRIQGLENISWLPFDGTRTLNNGEEIKIYEQKQIKEYYWLGTDNLGRDQFTRIWKGTQISLYIAFLAAFIDMIIGVAYGAISGYFGGRIDNVMQRIIEVLMGIPNLVVVILMILILKPGIISITVALTITGWVGMARVVRAQVLKLKNQEFVLASRTLGASHGKIIFKHLIPNLVGVIIINTMFTIPNAIFFEAFLSFIGLGLQDPLASLGTLIDEGFKSMRAFPYQMIYPAIVISVIMIAFNMIADGLRDALDPKMRD
ncbi:MULTISPECIES: oligopeptide ABC transporter permease [Bacillaceae]|uniref:ABC transporter permease n=1 Tax=Metabacillus hrfriensis TaxID=3048891 RepID=A0ACD4REG3_9BACI|nr:MULTISPECIES: oligopeptide ABC transporter permease [Bacillaceae]UOK58838.1 ABC transporter permease [Bacillus sp. OVS6]USK29642.1 ABC transporter permease [Bacillus sp. CMF21]MDQ0861208.1 oligopeptide transport system permease protein [Bacillus sp. V2I10]UAL53322.1 ABC transporter permease [Metabacillus dongyingensis]WHZ58886.1 ABC transporter permease [Metabacillus sp. CT-WN-B3]